MVKPNNSDIIYYLEHPEKIEFKNTKKLRKKQRKEIKKRKEEQTGEKVENIANFIIKIRSIIDEIKKEEISEDKLHEKINILLKSKTPTPPDSPGSLDGLSPNEADAELLRRHRQNLLDGYLEEKGLPQGAIKLRSVSPAEGTKKKKKKKSAKKKKKSAKKKGRKSLGKKSKKRGKRSVKRRGKRSGRSSRRR